MKNKKLLDFERSVNNKLNIQRIEEDVRSSLQNSMVHIHKQRIYMKKAYWFLV